MKYEGGFQHLAQVLTTDNYTVYRVRWKVNLRDTRYRYGVAIAWGAVEHILSEYDALSLARAINQAANYIPVPRDKEGRGSDG